MGVTQHGRTHRLDLADPTVREWTSTVLHADAEQGIVLDRSAFYPGGGGQPPDHGVLLWQGVQTRIVGTRKGDDPYLIPAEGDPLPPVGTAVVGAVEDERRTRLMRTHSGLHVLCGVVFRDFGALVTGGNMEPGEARMDFNLPEVPPDFKSRIEELVNAEVAADRSVATRVLPRTGRWPCRTSSAPSPTSSRRMSRRSGSSTSSGWTCRPTAAPTSPPPPRSARCRWSRWRARVGPTAGSGSDWSIRSSNEFDVGCQVFLTTSQA